MTKTHDSIVYRPGALGDVIVTLPLLDELRRRYPPDPITLIASPDAGALARASGHADRFLSVDTGWIARWHAGDVGAVHGNLGSPARLIIFSSSDDLAETARLAGIRCVTTRPPPTLSSDTAHAIDQILEVLDTPPYGVAPKIALRKEFIDDSHRLVEGDDMFGIIHAGASTPLRQWPRMTALAVQIQDRLGLRIFANRGPVEMERRLDADWPREFRYIGPLAATELAAVLSRAALYIGNDTGPTHLAAAVGTPTVAVFGPHSNVAEWGPRGERVTIVSADRNWPQTDTVFAACERSVR